MDKQEALNSMNSDHRLWEKAETKDLGGGRIEKVLTLPWGIGETRVTLEGMTDAGKRRAAVSGYGEYIRGVIEEAISDDAVTARAEQAAARAKQDDSGDSIILGGEQRVRDTPVPEEVDAPADQAHQGDAPIPLGFRETLIARRIDISSQRNEHERRVRELDKELRAINSAIESLEEDDLEETDPK